MEAFFAFEKRTKVAISKILEDLEATKKKLIGTKRSREEESLTKAVTSLEFVDRYLGPAKKLSSEESSYASIVRKPFDEEERKFTVLGKIPRAEKMPGFKPVIKEDATTFTPANWEVSANLFRFDTFDKFVNIFPHKREKETDEVKAIATEGCNPAEVYKLFCLGLLKAIYPGTDLEELSHFPTNFKKAIDIFVMKTKSKSKLFVSITGVPPIWDNSGKYLHPYQQVKIGSARTPPVLTKSAPLSQPADLDKYRDGAIIELFAEISRVSKMTRYKVNYHSKNLIILSMFKKEQKPNEQKQIDNWTKEIESFYLDEPFVEPATMEVEAHGPSPAASDQDKVASASTTTTAIMEH